MSDKIKKLTEKIYDEGIVKAREEASEIISNAKNEAAKIIVAAKADEAKILKAARNKAKELDEMTKVEIQLASRQAISNVKQQIQEIVTTAQVNAPIEEVFQDIDFIKKAILTLIHNWQTNQDGETDLHILLPEEVEKKISSFFNTNALNLLNKGVTLITEPKLTNGFKVKPKNGGYIISFTDNDFKEYFKQYLKNSTADLLFKNSKELETK